MATPQERHPELFRPTIVESPRGKSRSVPMECLSLGFLRTGTSTMSVALETLGIHTYHSMLFFSTNLGDIPMWREAIDNKFRGKGPRFGREEWDQLLHNFGGVSSDTPAIAFAEDLIETYPEAKVVLVERDIDSWYKSFCENIAYQMYVKSFQALYHPINHLAMWVDPWFAGPFGGVQLDVTAAWLGANNSRELCAKAKDAYKAHYRLIRDITPKERLLEYKLGDGWEPLCEFLGKPVPDTPFPYTNESAYLNEKITIFTRKRFAYVAGLVLKLGTPLLIAGAVYAWKRYGNA